MGEFTLNKPTWMLVGIFALSSTLPMAFAGTHTTNTNHNATIPRHMPGGTEIRYNQNDQMTIVKQSTYSQPEQNTQQSAPLSPAQTKKNKMRVQKMDKAIKERQSNKNIPVYHLGDPKLPKPQPGMVVTYDGLGDIFKVTLNGKTISPSSPTPSVTSPR